MKKVLLSMILLALTFVLFACDPYNVDSFREGDIVEMSNDDVVSMLSAVDWEAAGEAIQLDIHADVDIQTESSSSFFDSNFESSVDLNAVFDSTTYVQYSDLISDVALHSESELEFSYDTETTFNASTTSVDMSGSGALNVYFSEGFLYVNPSVDMSSNGTEFSISGKEKLNEEVTQAMWNEFNNEINIGDVNPGGMTSIYDIMTELLVLFDEEHTADFLEAFPMITVYQKGTVTNVHFEVDKAFILEHAEDLLVFMFDMMVESGEEVFTPEEISAEIIDALAELNEYMDYFDVLSMSMDIIIDGGNLVKYAASMTMKTVTGSLDDLGAAIDITFSIEANFGVNLPSFPNDLGDYTPVDEIGENYDFSSMVTLVN